VSRKSRKKKRRGSYFKVLTLLFLFLILAAILIISTYPERFFSRAGVFPAVAEGRFNTETVNVALLGFDRTAARDSQYSLYRPDTIMIAAINFKSGRVSLVSIPRDSYVNINGTEIYDKINHSYMYGYYRRAEGEDRHLGGIETTIKTIEDFLGGIAIHAYVLVDMDGAAEIVNNIGGVEIEVEKEVRSNYGRGDILVEAGNQILDGAAFMQYIRSRADNLGGERGRTERQQKAVISLFKQLISLKGLISLPSFYLSVRSNLDTTLNPLQMITLGLFGLRLDFENIDGYVFGGEGKLSNRDGQNIYYLLIDSDYRIEIIEMVFGVTVESLYEPYLPGPVGPEPDPETEQDELPDLLSVDEQQPDSEAEPEPELIPEPEPETEIEPESEPDPDPEIEPDPEPDPEDADEPTEDTPSDGGEESGGTETGAETD
jgi:LCP family protein required for cell wall assembly